VAPYRWSVSAGGLPGGLSLSAAGAITGTPTKVGTPSVVVKVTDSALPTAASATRTLALSVLAPRGQSVLYVGNGSNAITEYAPGASGNAAPLATIAGAATGLSFPSGLTVSASRQLYVGDAGNQTIAEYAPGASGNARPSATIAGASTAIDGPDALSLDAAGDLWVANYYSSTVTEYAPEAKGDAAPLRTIAGPGTGLNRPLGLAIDAAGDIWVSNNAGGAPAETVTEYAHGAHGNAAPLATLGGPATGLVGLHKIAFDPLGDLYVAEGTVGPPKVERFAPGAHGNAAPTGVIGGSLTGFVQPVGLTVDPAGELYVVDATAGAGAVDEFAFGAAGDVAPAVSVVGATTGLNFPSGLAVAPPAPLGVSTASLPGVHLGGAYSSTLKATGGVPPYRWSVSAGALPAGLSLSSAGTIAGTPASTGTSTFTAKVTDSAAPLFASATCTLSVSVSIVPGVYVADNGSNAITEYPLTATEDPPPTVAISGPDTGLNAPISVILDASGRTYVANNSAGTVTEYSPGASGDSSPLLTITGIVLPGPLALNGAGDLFVATANNTIREYAPGAHGAATPIATITRQNNPEGLGFNAAGDLFVSENSTTSINEYAPGADGAAAPINTISGGATGLSSPQSLVIDPTGDLTVANAGNGTATVYAPGASGNATPAETLTGLQIPVGVDRGTDRTVFVGDIGLNAIIEYAPGASTPTASFSGLDTGLNDPVSVAATPPLSVLTTHLPKTTQGRRALVNLTAGEGTTPYRWTLRRGHLPRGLRLTPRGAIQGIPRARDRDRRYHFTVQVTDASHPAQTARQTLTVAVTRGRIARSSKDA
jgi:sugar lactone lactonase YvrE